MSRSKTFNLIFSALFILTAGWILYFILTYNNYYSGQPLTNLKVTINSKPEVYFSGDAGESFYYFTVREYQNEFRIDEGAKKIISENTNSKKILEGLKKGDTINVFIQTSESVKLVSFDSRIYVIGISNGNKLIIDPEIVKQNDKKIKAERLFLNYLFIGIIIIALLIKLFKSRIR